MDAEIEKSLKECGFYMTVTEGDSMYPMIKTGTTVLIKVPEFPLKKYDVPVYRSMGHYTMHRIVHVGKNGYVICGDNRAYLERNVLKEDIVGVLDGYYVGEQFIEASSEEGIWYGRCACAKLPWKLMRRWIRKIAKFVLK